MSNLKERIHSSMIAAMRGKRKEELKAIRMLVASVKQKEIDERIELDDNQTITVITKMIKQRNESIKLFAEGNRPDLVETEQNEIDVLQEFLPPQLSEDEINTAITTAIKSTNASSVRDMGKVMGALKKDLQGRADMGKVGEVIKTLLSTI